MSFASRLKSLLGIETKAAPSLADGSGFYFDLFGATSTLAGVTVTPHSAMTCAPVACAVRSISEAAGSLPIHVYKKLPDGGKEKATDHPLYKLLHDAPNSFAPAALFRTQVMADALLQPHGGFALINRVDGGKPAELIRLDPQTQSVAVDTSDVEPTYKLNGRQIDGADLIHIPTPAYDARKGLVGEGREIIALALVLERHASRLFGNGARPSGVLSLKGTVTPDALGKAKAAWQATLRSTTQRNERPSWCVSRQEGFPFSGGNGETSVCPLSQRKPITPRSTSSWKTSSTPIRPGTPIVLHVWASSPMQW
ncbi:phage portal protein [Bradyrhizobium sp. NBAIM08]|nr:phage portal protein [Bradyrhizobium sp. NBAIM08]